MFIGAIGYTYAYGISSLWLLFAWSFGDLLASFVFPKVIHEKTSQRNLVSYVSLVSDWYGKNLKVVSRVAGCCLILFLRIYASAQFSAGGKALYVLFGWKEGLELPFGQMRFSQSL